MVWRVIAGLLLLPGLPGLAAADARSTMELCRDAAVRAADAHGIPREIMLAITLVETRTRRGGESGPWPWTVNVAGKGRWFPSRAAALVHAQQSLAGGQTSFDVGCFQLNYRWHGEAFASIDAMFEPNPSGDYAARFLKGLHAETGDWIRATGLYHSRHERHASRYRALVARAVARITGNPAPDPPRVAAMPERRRPVGLLRRGRGALIAATAPSVGAPASAGGVALVIVRQAGGGLLDRGRAGKGG